MLVSHVYMERYILAIGLAFREINLVNDTEPDADLQHLPPYFAASQVDFSRRVELERLCVSLTARLNGKPQPSQAEDSDIVGGPSPPIETLAAQDTESTK